MSEQQLSKPEPGNEFLVENMPGAFRLVVYTEDVVGGTRRLRPMTFTDADRDALKATFAAWIDGCERVTSETLKLPSGGEVS